MKLSWAFMDLGPLGGDKFWEAGPSRGGALKRRGPSNTGSQGVVAIGRQIEEKGGKGQKRWFK